MNGQTRLPEHIREKCVSIRVVKDYTDTVSVKSTPTPKWCQHGQRLRWHRFSVVYKPNSNNLKKWKCSYLKKNLSVGVVVDFADTWFLNFAIEYLRENEKVRKTVFSCSYGAQIECFKQNKCRKSCDTVPVRDWRFLEAGLPLLLVAAYY